MRCPKRAMAAGGLIVSLAFLVAVNRSEKATGQQPYPKVNLAISYKVDPHWPQMPTEFMPAAVSGVHADPEDRVWIFTRSVPPVQLYEADGTFLGGWGNEHVVTAHHIEVDHEGNIWLADIGLHVVRKFTPAGELLLTLGTPGEPGEDTERCQAENRRFCVGAGLGLRGDGQERGSQDGRQRESTLYRLKAPGFKHELA